jgi:tetratricopeptide (TPR) repeat protein
MDELEKQRLDRAYSSYHAEDYESAVQQLRDLAATTTNPWDKAELLYHEAMFLQEMGKVSDARARVSELNIALESLVGSPFDGSEFDVPVSLPVMARHADLKVSVKEGTRLKALRQIEDLIARYPRQLSLPQFRAMFEEVKTLRGVLLAELGRWNEARSFLEETAPPEVWRTYYSYYLGLCYYELGNFQRAREQLSEAIELGLTSSWVAKAHFILGLVEYRLSDMKAAKHQFELCVSSPDQRYIEVAEVWRGLEETSKALGLYAEAENYQRLRIGLKSDSKVN